MTTHEEKSEVITQNDTRLRILYLYQLLSEQSDENHPLTTNQIISKMQEQHTYVDKHGLHKLARVRKIVSSKKDQNNPS